MGYTTNGGGIIKGNPMSWFIVLVSLAAFGTAIVFGVELTRGRPDRHTDWAPEGCTVARNRDNGTRVIIIVSDEEAFDTEAECASVILAVLDGEEEFFRRRAYGNLGRVVEINFPGESDIPRGILQYMEIEAPRHYITLRWMDGENALYQIDAMSIELLQKIASGETELGFLK